MQKSAVEQARRRLSTAKTAYHDYQSATNFEGKKQNWTLFLTALSTIYSKLEQGSKGSGKSQAWFGRRKRERKTDDLLSYLHHARNSDEHGLEEVTEAIEWRVDLNKGRGSITLDGNLDIVGVSAGPKGSPKVSRMILELVSVRDDRYVIRLTHQNSTWVSLLLARI